MPDIGAPQSKQRERKQQKHRPQQSSQVLAPNGRIPWNHPQIRHVVRPEVGLVVDLPLDMRIRIREDAIEERRHRVARVVAILGQPRHTEHGRTGQQQQHWLQPSGSHNRIDDNRAGRIFGRECVTAQQAGGHQQPSRSFDDPPQKQQIKHRKQDRRGGAINIGGRTVHAGDGARIKQKCRGDRGLGLARAASETDHQPGSRREERQMHDRRCRMPSKREGDHVNQFHALREACVNRGVERHKSVRADIVRDDAEMVRGAVWTDFRRNRIG